MCPNDDAVLAKGLFEPGAEVLPPAGFQHLGHDFHDDDIIEGACLRETPGALGRRARIGGEAAELLHQVAMDGGQHRLAERLAVIVVGGEEDLDEVHGGSLSPLQRCTKRKVSSDQAMQ
jgi:hypothetical protein